MTARSKQLEKLAEAVNVLMENYNRVEKEYNDLKAEHESLQKRAKAESILIAFNENRSSAPIGLQTNSIEEFLQKRAKLEKSTDDHLEKVASMVEYFEGKSEDYDLYEEENDQSVDRDVLHNFLNNI